MRLETLLLKRRAAATRVLPDSLGDYATKDHVEWNAVEEGFHLLERDLGKLQVYDNGPLFPCTSIPNISPAIRRDQRHWVSENSEEMGQAFEIHY